MYENEGMNRIGDTIADLRMEVSRLNAELAHYKRLGMVLDEQVEYHIRENEGIEFEIIRLRKIESAAIAAVAYEQWTGDTFYDLMIDLQKALHE